MTDANNVNPRLLQVIQTHELRGSDPNSKLDPPRRVPHYWLTDGTFLGTAPDQYREAQIQVRMAQMQQELEQKSKLISDLEKDLAEERELLDMVNDEAEENPPPPPTDEAELVEVSDGSSEDT